MTDLFVYGVLLSARIRHALLGKEHPAREATLHGYARKKISELPHAGIVEQENSSVDGLLLEGISIPDTTIIDKFQEDHERRLVEIKINGETRIASTHIPKKDVQLSDEEWKPEEFAYVDFYLETVIPEFYDNLKE